MIEIAKLPVDDRRELFHNTAAKIGLHDAIVEKDFWVCLTLDYLFHRSPWKKSVTFKGGTSLSKGYHLISRFSEDIDLILDWRVLGYEINEPWEKRSNTKQDVFNKEANRKAEIFLAKTFCPQVREGLSAELGLPANLYIDEEDKQTMIFAYPNLFTDASTLQVIRLEIGALAAWTPAILHHEANRPEHLSMPQRYSRHYYDLYCMAKSPVKDKAFARLDLLQKVVNFKIKFYPRAWARYPEAVPATIKLLPPLYRLDTLQEDYTSMQNMLYGEIPSFKTMMETVGELEEEIHTL